ncbi:MAG: hypothetical protein FJ116_00535, partial [Deltaproteobacteria bacterium]|nr:hypothetical protein [Deltaproteobacteria bacterium]
MKRYQIKLAGLLLLCSLLPSQAIYAEGPGEHDSQGNSVRRETGRPKISEKFDELIKVLRDKKDGTFVFTLKKDEDASQSQITLTTEKINDLKKKLEEVKKYAEKLLKCSEGSTDDKVSLALLTTLNEFITHLSEQKVIGQFETKGTLTDKSINTFVVRIQKSLKEKATRFENSKNEFEKADKEVSEQLEAIANLLQGDAWDKNLFDQESVNGDSARKAIKDSSEDAKMCKLDAEATTDSTGPTPPVVDPSAPTTPGTLGGFIPPTTVPNGNAIVPGDFRTNQLEDLLLRAQDDRERERQLNEELFKRQFNERNRESDQAIKALQQALGQAQRPNVSRGNSDRSEQGPQISPSVSIPPSQQQL